MGEFIRRQWFPAIPAHELPAAGDAPKPIRLLGEDLVIFRQEDGRLGLLGGRCPHRGVSLTVARNEGCGLRCIYHGWLMTADGAVIDMPAEPHAETFMKKVRTASYPTVEAGGMVWIYMGGSEPRPPLPTFEWLGLPPENISIKSTRLPVGFVRGIEGTMAAAEARSEIRETENGFKYAPSQAAAGGKTDAWMSEFVAPFYSLSPVPPPSGASRYRVFTAHVPIDDGATSVYLIDYSHDGSPDGQDPAVREAGGASAGLATEDARGGAQAVAALHGVLLRHVTAAANPPVAV